MRTTIFDTPVLHIVLRWVALLYLKLFGWRLEGHFPTLDKFVLIAAPHTSNWDLPVTLCVAFAYRAKIFWMGKNTLFREPFGTFFRWLGGIPVDRSGPHNLVARMVEVFRENEKLVVVIPPEGSRKKVRVWKTGFYYIAHGAGVPIAMGFVDYGRMTAGIGPVFAPTGDIEKDMIEIRAFYADIKGKYPEKSGLATLAADGEQMKR